jgi:WD40 repeat protein
MVARLSHSRSASMATIALADLIAQGVHLEPQEAIAIAQLLIENGAAAPSPENVQLTTDGDAWCAGCDVTPAVFEIAVLLQTLIPPGTPRVPGGLRYAIARALLEVDAPPFDSIHELSRSLERFEDGDRRSVIRALAGRRLKPVTLRIVPPPSPPAEVVMMPRRVPQRAPRDRRVAAAAAALLVGTLGLIGVADVMKARHVPPRTVAGAGRAIAPAPASVVDTPRTPPPAASAPRAAASIPRTARAAAAHTRQPDDGEVVPALDRQRRPIFSPAFASNGSALFFHTGSPRDARSAIAMASGDPATGGDFAVMTIVDDGARNYHVQPSPDGARVAFDSDRDGERGVYVARRDGTNVRRISGPGYAAVPTWAPDGRRIAYIRAEADNPKVWNLWIQSLDDDRATRLTDFRYGQTWSASWFPDDRRVCYSHEDTLVVRELESGRTRSFASPVARHLVRTPAVSPDGTQIIFQVYRQGAWILDLQTGAMRPVLADPTAEEFAWSPDGRRVAFHSRRDGQWGIFVVSRD